MNSSVELCGAKDPNNPDNQCNDLPGHNPPHSVKEIEEGRRKVLAFWVDKQE